MKEHTIENHPNFHKKSPVLNNLSISDFYDPIARQVFDQPTIPEKFTDTAGNTRRHPHAGQRIPTHLQGLSTYLTD